VDKLFYLVDIYFAFSIYLFNFYLFILFIFLHATLSRRTQLQTNKPTLNSHTCTSESAEQVNLCLWPSRTFPPRKPRPCTYLIHRQRKSPLVTTILSLPVDPQAAEKFPQNMSLNTTVPSEVTPIIARPLSSHNPGNNPTKIRVWWEVTPIIAHSCPTSAIDVLGGSRFRPTSHRPLPQPNRVKTEKYLFDPEMFSLPSNHQHSASQPLP